MDTTKRIENKARRLASTAAKSRADRLSVIATIEALIASLEAREKYASGAAAWADAAAERAGCSAALVGARKKKARKKRLEAAEAMAARERVQKALAAFLRL